jgi:hypothetical protein
MKTPATLVPLVWLFVTLALNTSASAAEFGLLACSLDRQRGLVVTVADFVDADGIAGPRGSVFVEDPLGLPCATAIHTARQHGYELAARGEASLCETGICPNPPPPPPPPSPPSRPSDPDDDIWDLLSSGVQGSPTTAIAACRLVAADGQPRIVFVQTSGTGPMNDALVDARGRPCSEVISEVLGAGGKIGGRSFLPLSAALGEKRRSQWNARNALPGRSDARPDSIVYEFVRRQLE